MTVTYMPPSPWRRVKETDQRSRPVDLGGGCFSVTEESVTGSPFRTHTICTAHGLRSEGGIPLISH